MGKLRTQTLSMMLVIFSIVILTCGILFKYPVPEDDELVLERFDLARAEEPAGLSVMSFNVRLDTYESNPDNHFRQRVHRLSRVLSRTRAELIGLQEPFADQLLHLVSVLPVEIRDEYRWMGLEREPHDLGHPSRHDDYNVALLYNGTRLTLIHHDHVWLSETPRTKSKSWASFGYRSLNMAEFQDNDNGGRTVFAFNTHLDVGSELARRNQATLAVEFINLFMEASGSPSSQAVAFMFGDFNTAPGYI